MKKLKLLFSLLSLLLFSCSTSDLTSLEETSPQLKLVSKGITSKGAYFPTADFDWENATTISYNGRDIMLPWTSGASAGQIPLEIKNDFKKMDGWELLYNTFPYAAADPMFVLYNKFTGIARFFMFVTNTTYSTSNFTWGFQITTSNCTTSAFNFTKINPLAAASVLTNPTLYSANYSSSGSIPNGIIPNSWYYCDLEFSYDPNIASLTHDNIEFQCQCFLTNISTVALSGTIQGSIDGTFMLPSDGSTPALSDNIVKQINFENLGAIKIPTLTQATKWLTAAGTSIADNTLQNMYKSGISLLSSSLTTSNPILGLITNGILTTSPSSPGKISLVLNANQNLKGTITSQLPGPNPGSFMVPGTQTTNKGGYLPHYNYPLGVWNIDKTPNIIATRSAHADKQHKPFWNYQIKLDIDPNSFNILLNNDVIQSCSSYTITKEIICEPYLIDKVEQGSYINGGEIQGKSVIYSYIDDGPGQAVASCSCKVKITIQLTPIGRSNPTVLIKEFPATMTIK